MRAGDRVLLNGPSGAGKSTFASLLTSRALLHGAELVVLDESFAALAPENLRRGLQCVLARACTLLVRASLKVIACVRGWLCYGQSNFPDGRGHQNP